MNFQAFEQVLERLPKQPRVAHGDQLTGELDVDVALRIVVTQSTDDLAGRLADVHAFDAQLRLAHARQDQ